MFNTRYRSMLSLVGRNFQFKYYDTIRVLDTSNDMILYHEFCDIPYFTSCNLTFSYFLFNPLMKLIICLLDDLCLHNFLSFNVLLYSGIAWVNAYYYQAFSLVFISGLILDTMSILDLWLAGRSKTLVSSCCGIIS